jgi:hypothetical protein
LSLLSKSATNVRDLVVLGSFMTSVFTAMTTLVLTFGWPIFVEKLSADLDMATKTDVAAITERMDKIAGEDRIFRMREGHSFIQEPVTKGQPIAMTLTGNRTKRGASCVFLGATPLFIDDRDIPYPGDEILPVRQFTVTQARIHLTLKAPDILRPGRVGVHLSMHYQCPFGLNGNMLDIYEETETLFFEMLP